MDLIDSIYHEKQDQGSMLCAQHCLNNLLQNQMFSVEDLAGIAQSLDELENSHLDETVGVSENYDDSGFFSIMVMEEALGLLGLRLARWQSEEMKDRHDYPEQMEGFVLNHNLHWYTIRRFSTPQRFYNLDSCVPTPQWISPLLLNMQLHAAEQSGYSIFVVVPTSESGIKGLPNCPAAERALGLAPPKSNNREKGLTSSTFKGTGHSLGGASSNSASSSASTSNSRNQASTSSSSSKITRPTQKRRPSTPTLQDRTSPPSNSAETSSVEEESERRRIRPRFEIESTSYSNGGSSSKEGKNKKRILTEEEEMDIAIAQSLGQSVKVDESDEEEDEEEVLILSGDDDDDEEVEVKGKVNGSNSRSDNQESSSNRKSETVKKGRGEQDEDAELARAIQESMKMGNSSGKGKEIEGGEEGEEDQEEEVDDELSVEELRRRRLARFG